MPTAADTRLGRLARRREALPERCDLCAAPMGADHRHLLEPEARELQCACRACSLLFDRGGGRYLLIPTRRVRLDDLELSDLMWEELRLPVDIAFFLLDSRADRVMAYYPSPMGATESHLELDAWQQLEAANPVLGTLEPDVEALLVNRAQGSRQHWLVPIDDCFRLVAVIRTHWKGLTGGRDVWQQIPRYFDELSERR